jgi:serine phosphatase RsbU (regulator of sigma subunit)
VADWCIIETLSPAGAVEHVAVSHRDRTAASDLARFLEENPIASTATGPVAAVLKSGEARLLGPDAVGKALHEAAADRGQPDVAGSFQVQASVIVPIEVHGQVLGVIVLSTDGDRLLDVDDLDLAVEVAHRAGLALGNARAFQQEQRIAESLQRSLLPDVGEASAGIELSVRYVAATDGAFVGGDWYDVIPLPEGRMGLVVGDVVGHDLAATSAMGQLRSILRAFVYEDHVRPIDPLTRIDRLFEPLGMSHATCVLGILDPPTGRLQWSAAGHPPPLLVRGGEARYLEGGGGALLGLAAGAHAQEAEETLEPGDFVVLYTDGLIERRGESIVDGLERLRSTAATIRAASTDELCAGLVDALLPQGAAREDDVALLVVRWAAATT